MGRPVSFRLATEQDVELLFEIRTGVQENFPTHES